MSLNFDWYVDDNETIYVTDYAQFDSFDGSDSRNLTWGLAEIVDLSGQSTVFLNKITFKLSGYIEPEDTCGSQPVAVFANCGIAPVDYLDADENPTNRLDYLSDYQDVKGWPLKGCHSYANYAREIPNPSIVPDTGIWQGVGSTLSWQRTYSPRKALLLSRLQVVVFNIVQTYVTGGCFKGWISMSAQLKRGD